MKKEISGAEERGRESSAGSPDRYTEEAATHIRDHLRKTEEVVRALRKDLDYYRAQSDRLLRERDDLSGLAGRAESDGREIAALKNETNILTDERNRLAGAHDSLRERHAQLQEHCARLEAALAEEQKRHEEAQQAVVYLEAQIQELESMVEMLRNRAELGKNKGDK